MITENYDFASNIDMAKAMSNINYIAKQIAEKDDAVICKAFTISIARLLKENGIIPIMTEHERMLETEERFIIKSTHGVCFNELDTSEHDAKVRADAIYKYKHKLITDVSARAQSFEKTHDKHDSEIFNYATRTFVDALKFFEEELKEKK